MSVTAVGPALDLDGPLPVARKHTLLDTRWMDPAGEQQSVLKAEAGDRWLNGVNVYGYPDGVPRLWEPCSTGTFRPKEEGDEVPGARFDAFVLYFPLTCSRLGMGDFDVWSSRARAAINATQSHAIEAMLANGVMGSTNPFLGDTNLVALSGGVVSPAVGKSYLDNAIGARTGRQGMIHATPAVVDRWGEGNGLEETDDGLFTTAGTPVISGSGYIYSDPVSQPSGSTEGSPSTIDWVYATGPVEVRILDGVEINEDEALDRSDNTVVYRAERYALVEWDTALQVGIRIDWSL